MEPFPRIDDGLVSRLPLPLAQLCLRAQDAKTPAEQLLNSFYLWEATLRLVGSVVLLEFAGRDEPLPTIAKQIAPFAQPTLANCWNWVSQLVPWVPESEAARFRPLRQAFFGPPTADWPRAAALAELLREVIEGRRSPRAALSLMELVELLLVFRRQEIGAQSQRSPEFLTRMAAALLAAFAEVFGRIDPLGSAQLLYCGGVRPLAQETLIDDVPPLMSLVGDKVTPFVSSSPLPASLWKLTGRVIGRRPSETFFDLSPLVTYRHVGEFFFLQAVNKQALEFLSYTSGTTANLQIVGEWDRLSERAFQGIATAPKLPDMPISAPTVGSLSVTASVPLDSSVDPVRTVVVGTPFEAPSAASARSDPSAPRKIGEFDVVRSLGEGGIGHVYEVWQSTLGRRAALKIMRLREPAAAARFRREIKVLGKVVHPNLVKIYSEGEFEGQPYFVMELLDGRPINEFSQADVKETQIGAIPLPDTEKIRRLVALCRQVADALACLHAAGIIHGDPKPSNIMVTPDGARAILFDLNLAAFEGEQSDESAPGVTVTRIGQILGTPAYMSPEQTEGRRTFSSDVYGLGVVLWELLTGRRLFDGPNVFELLDQVRHRETMSIRQLNPRVPNDLEAIVFKCLEKDPTQRYRTGRELANDLDRWLEGNAVQARPTHWRSFRRFLFEQRWRAAWIGGILLVILQGIFIGAFPRAVASTEEASAVWNLSGWIVAAILALAVAYQQVRLSRIVPQTPDSKNPSRQDTPADTQKPRGAAALRDKVLDLVPPPAAKVETTRQVATEGRPRMRTQDDEAFSSQTVVLRYPAPIAIAYRRFCSRKDPRDRLAQLFDTFEITLKYLAYLGLSDLTRSMSKTGPPFEALPRHQGFDLLRRSTRMTLGRWIETVRNTADALGKRPDRFVQEMPEICGSGSMLDREIFSWLGANRNAATHRRGGISLLSEKCEPLLKEARPKLERLFQEISFVRRYPLGFVRAGFPVGGNRVRYRVHSCMGARVAFGEEVYPMETTDRLPEEVPFIVARDESAVLCLWPFLLFRESDATQRPSLYVFEEIEAERKFLTRIVAAAVDHEDQWVKELRPDEADSHDWFCEALLKLPQVVPITPALRLSEGLAESLVGRLSGESLGEHKQYKLLGPIAKGGFGTVYDAEDVRDGSRVAIKVLEEREGLDPKEDQIQFRRFQQEYEKLVAAGHDFSGIVRCFEWGVDILGRREYPWYSMEFATGGDLNERLVQRSSNLGGKLVWDIPELRQAAIDEFRAVAAAVAHLHDSNVIHRDIKPANVLLMDGGELRLSDFGLVKVLDRPHPNAHSSSSVGPGSTRGTIVGTRDYMAPEQANGQTVTKATDVYALGMVLAELLAGRRPRPTPGIAAGSPIENDPLVDKLPEPIRQLIVQCTDIDSAQRHQDARYVLHQFEQAVKRSNVST
jgi:serine/threonine protein kinase